MHQLTIVGLGPGHMDYLTMEAMRVLKKADKIYLRTDKHPLIDDLKTEGFTFSSFDHLYEAAEDFDEVYTGIHDALMTELSQGDVVYAVPGNPFVAEKTVQLLIKTLGLDQIIIVHGTSFLDAIITRLGIDPVEGMRVVDALRLDTASKANDDVLVCIQSYDTRVASDLKIWLTDLYQDDHPAWVVKAVGIPDLEQVHELKIYELDRFQGYDHLTSVVIPKNTETKRHSYDDLLRIMTTLRSENGCPWDREQDHASLQAYVLEEAYEVAEAIQEGDLFALEEELGDLLLQIVFHAQIGSENGDFSMSEVLDAICTKMIDRHPHVFSDLVAHTSQDVLTHWEAIKKVENNHDTVTDTMAKFGKSLPALFRAYKVQKKAEKAGFDWDDINPVFDKLTEEVTEFKHALEQNDLKAMHEELGDLLFTLVNLGRKSHLDVELALHHTTDKFIDRFSRVEQEFTDLGLNMENIGIEDLEKAWQRAKK